MLLSPGMLQQMKISEQQTTVYFSHGHLSQTRGECEEEEECLIYEGLLYEICRIGLSNHSACLMISSMYGYPFFTPDCLKIR